MSHRGPQEAGHIGRLSKKFCGLKLTPAQVQPQTRSYHSMGGAEQGGKGHSTAYIGAPSPILTHLVTSSRVLSIPFPLSQALHRRGKMYHPIQDTPPHPTHMGETRSTARLGSAKKPGTEKEAGLVLSFLVRFPLSLRCRHPRRCRLNSPAAPQCFSLLLAHGSHQPRFHVGARRFGWEGVGDRGLRCQRPPPLEVGRERIHLCCLLFVCTCLAICLSLSCSPATGKLRVLGSRRLQLYA